MPSRPQLDDLLTVRENCLLAAGWAGTLEMFREDRKTFYAVMRALEIISEASRRLPQSVRDRHPHLPWRAIRDVGNFYRHQYNVVEDFVWRTVTHDLPSLLAAVDGEIARLGGDP